MQPLTYDIVGKPYAWQNGRRLASLQTSRKNIQYTYDADGLRVTKTVDGTKHTYQYVGGQLRYETRGNISFSYEYDAYGNLSCINYIQVDGTAVKYYVVCNSRGDVTAIYDAEGTLQAKYSYISWGHTLSITDANGNAITSANHIGNLNMIRYRGYYFDSESGFYYLQSRYYDPGIVRFINADGYVSTGQGLTGTNMFAYCGNNPVNRIDSTGCSWVDGSSALKENAEVVFEVIIGGAASGAVGTGISSVAIVVGGLAAMGLLLLGVVAYGSSQMTCGAGALAEPVNDETKKRQILIYKAKRRFDFSTGGPHLEVDYSNRISFDEAVEYLSIPGNREGVYTYSMRDAIMIAGAASRVDSLFIRHNNRQTCKPFETFHVRPMGRESHVWFGIIN